MESAHELICTVYSPKSWDEFRRKMETMFENQWFTRVVRRSYSPKIPESWRAVDKLPRRRTQVSGGRVQVSGADGMRKLAMILKRARINRMDRKDQMQPSPQPQRGAPATAQASGLGTRTVTDPAPSGRPKLSLNIRRAFHSKPLGHWF